MQARAAGSSPVDSNKNKDKMSTLTKIFTKGLTLIVKNHGIIILYLDKETLIKKFNVFCQNTLLYNYNAFMTAGVAIFLNV